MASDRAKIEVVDAGQERAVQVASTLFTQRNADLAHYKVKVVRHGNSIVVIFTDKNAPAGGRGNLGSRPGFEVEMNADDLRVLRSNFIR